MGCVWQAVVLYQAVLTVANQIVSSAFFERAQHGLAVFRLEILEQRALLGFFSRCSCYIDGFHGDRVQTRIIHASGNRAGGWVEVLYLFGTHAFTLEEHGKFDGVFYSASGVGRHQIRHQELLFTLAFCQLVKPLFEGEIGFDFGQGRMMEDIVFLETKMSFSQCEVFKLVFASGEFDMVVFDPKTSSCSIYEIKHSAEIVSNQYRHLTDEQKCKETEFRFGEITGKYVIYRGETQDVEDIHYINVEEYLNGL